MPFFREYVSAGVEYVSINSTEIIHDNICAHDHLSGATIRNGETINFSESLGRGRAASGDLDAAGCITISINGVPPRGEAGALEAAQIW